MRILRNSDAVPSACRHAVVALGNFDGVHLGHQAILRHTIEKAHELNTAAAVMTFEPHPREFFVKNHHPLRIVSLRKKLELLKHYGIENLFLLRFNHALASMTATEFVMLLTEKIAARHIVTGVDFAFGRNREGTVDYLRSALAAGGIGYSCIAPVQHDRQTISSSAVRTLLAKGDMPAAAILLGRPYSITGRVRHGDERGRTLGYPTANLGLSRLCRPRFGIYAARVVFRDGSRCGAVANLGIRPMFALEEPQLEVHCFGISRMFYGESIEVELIAFLREEKNFSSTELLRAQMAEDSIKAKELLECA